ncbi:MAG: Crp/Fnr family transcriptional regulator, partial [Senegalimassilia anaerobia]|nr:Crp/Fnr family transcriptional regulator [Senegalimassilia anaerobia]
MRAGQPTEYLGIVLSGRVRIEVSDAWGETTILDILGPGSLFAHGYACSMEPLDIDVLADSACEAVLLKAERIIHPCPKQCGCHAHISSNLMRALALSNLDMNRRAIAMTPKTIRGKILAFLSQQQKKAG